MMAWMEYGINESDSFQASPPMIDAVPRDWQSDELFGSRAD